MSAVEIGLVEFTASFAVDANRAKIHPSGTEAVRIYLTAMLTFAFAGDAAMVACCAWMVRWKLDEEKDWATHG